MKTKTATQTKYDHVLLVDEDQIDNFINERMVTSSNFSRKVTVKNSAQAALEYLTENTDNAALLPEIIFLDLNMPIMDGFGFLEEFHKMALKTPSLKENIKIIVLSSSISPADIDKASTNPYVVKYINKPLSEKYLEAINV